MSPVRLVVAPLPAAAGTALARRSAAGGPPMSPDRRAAATPLPAGAASPEDRR